MQGPLEQLKTPSVGVRNLLPRLRRNNGVGDHCPFLNGNVYVATPFGMVHPCDTDAADGLVYDSGSHARRANLGFGNVRFYIGSIVRTVGGDGHRRPRLAHRLVLATEQYAVNSENTF